ncbi:hypothetical protein P775_22020 [Puniceibacterium antarcticum]|uniref:Uncharacterized protein n=1 Tax=Puniceibacterium antarcticum TaxID=1206336 RepID=A0A2G8R998_9RHOB|nr:hypothetical protein P775_22020 [Puniceibacterium antarcticum]
MHIVGITRQGPNAQDKPLVDGSGQSDLDAELVALSGFAFGNAVQLGVMQGIDLAAAPEALMQQATDEHEGVQNALAQGATRNLLQLAADIAQDAGGVTLQLFQSLAHTPKLEGMGLAPNLQGQARGKTVVVLA